MIKIISQVLTIIVITIVVLSPARARIIDVPDEYSTIQEGIDASGDGDTVLVSIGSYREVIDFRGRRILLSSMFSMTGDSSYVDSTIIDGGARGPIVSFVSGEDTNSVLDGFTITNGRGNRGTAIECIVSSPLIVNNRIIDNQSFINFTAGISIENGSPVIRNNSIMNNAGFRNGGGIFCYESQAIITGNHISGNTSPRGGGICCLQAQPVISENVIMLNETSELGGGICCRYSDPEISHNIIVGNIADFEGGGIYCYNSTPLIVNNVVSGNTAGDSGGGIFCQESSPVITNTIFWNDSAAAYFEVFCDEFSNAVFSYCDIDGGYTGEGNIDVDPLFRDLISGDYHLMATYCGDPYDSPCIDAGDPHIRDSVLDCAWGLGDQISDIGAYGGGDTFLVEVEDEQIQIPSKPGLSHNYPNPFNSITTIVYGLAERSFVELDVYNLCGQKIAGLVSEYQSPGRKMVAWNASDYSTGIYFYKLTIAGETFTKRMTLLK
jgi:predicted outer membrane repeat protein